MHRSLLIGLLLEAVPYIDCSTLPSIATPESLSACSPIPLVMPRGRIILQAAFFISPCSCSCTRVHTHARVWAHARGHTHTSQQVSKCTTAARRLPGLSSRPAGRPAGHPAIRKAVALVNHRGDLDWLVGLHAPL